MFDFSWEQDRLDFVVTAAATRPCLSGGAALSPSAANQALKPGYSRPPPCERAEPASPAVSFHPNAAGMKAQADKVVEQLRRRS